MDINFFGLSLPDLMLIMVVALIIFGPDKLPQFARTAGKYVREFRRMSQEVRTQVSREITLSVKDDEGKEVGIEQYFVQVRDEVKGALNDVKQSLTTETAAVKSALTIDPNLLKNVTSDNITTTVITNPDTPQAQTIASQTEANTESQPLNLPTNFASTQTLPEVSITPRPSRLHTLSLDKFTPAVAKADMVKLEATALRSSVPQSLLSAQDEVGMEILGEGMPFSEYEKTFGSYDMVDLGAESAADGGSIPGSGSTVVSRKPRISKRGAYNSRSRN